MKEFECFVSGAAGAVIEAESVADAQKIYLEMLRSELSVKDIVAVEIPTEDV